MSHFATPLIVVNLGCEMIYVIEQRLKAQKIEPDKAQRVLTDIVTVLLHPKLLDELFIPQPVATHSVIKQLLQDISTTSIMKLDDYSMSKLWDLMTMIFKWQLAVATNQNIFDITRRHLKNVAMIMPEIFPKSIVEHAMNRFESLAQRFNENDYKGLHNTMILWFSEYHTKISVLLRLGLQNKNGTFSLPSEINPKFLKNLGENIYIYDCKKNTVEEYESRCADTHEISCLVSTIETFQGSQIEALNLPIELGHNRSTHKTSTQNMCTDTQFQKIITNFKNNSGNDLTFTPDIPKSPQEDLLAMLDSI